VRYGRDEIEIVRGTAEEGHNLHIFTTSRDLGPAIEMGLQFLSEISWLYDTSVEILTFGGGGHKTPMNIINRRFSRVQNVILLEDYRKISRNQEDAIALGLFREGRSARSIYYSFLSYFKIINLHNSTGPSQISWINANIGHVKDSIALRTMSELSKQGISDIGDHLYRSGRCAIAHAYISDGKKIVNPNSFDDYARISQELPIIKDLSKTFIIRELALPTEIDLYKEIQFIGFKSFFTKGQIEAIKNGSIRLSDLPELPSFTLRLYGIPIEYSCWRRLDMKPIKVQGGILTLCNAHQRWFVVCSIDLDFNSDETHFDAFNVAINPKKGIFRTRFFYDLRRFWVKYFLNGRIEIFRSDTKTLVARLPAYVPTNVDFRRSIDKLRGSAEKIRKRILSNRMYRRAWRFPTPRKFVQLRRSKLT